MMVLSTEKSGFRMNPAVKNGEKFSFYRYSGTATSALWTLGWAAAAVVATLRWAGTGDSTDCPNVFLALFVAIFGCLFTVRAYRREPDSEPEKNYPPESLGRRISGWFATLAWGGVGVLWNLSVLGVMLRAAYDGNSENLLIMIPFSLIGWFLLLMVCVMVTMALDSILESLRGTSRSSQNRSGADGHYPPQS